MATDDGGFTSHFPPTPAYLPSPRQYLNSSQESRLISFLDTRIAKISSRVTKRHHPGGYTSLHGLSKDYFRLLQTLLTQDPPAGKFIVTQYLIRIAGDLNEHMETLPPAEDSRGIFVVLRRMDSEIAERVQEMGQTERVRLRSEVERARGVVAKTFEGYNGEYDVEDAIGRVYEHSLEELEGPFGVENIVTSAQEQEQDQIVMEDGLYNE
jgi:hypothetical protein